MNAKLQRVHQKTGDRAKQWGQAKQRGLVFILDRFGKTWGLKRSDR